VAALTERLEASNGEQLQAETKHLQEMAMASEFGASLTSQLQAALAAEHAAVQRLTECEQALAGLQLQLEAARQVVEPLEADLAKHRAHVAAQHAMLRQQQAELHALHVSQASPIEARQGGTEPLSQMEDEPKKQALHSSQRDTTREGLGAVVGEGGADGQPGQAASYVVVTSKPAPLIETPANSVSHQIVSMPIPGAPAHPLTQEPSPDGVLEGGRVESCTEGSDTVVTPQALEEDAGEGSSPALPISTNAGVPHRSTVTRRDRAALGSTGPSSVAWDVEAGAPSAELVSDEDEGKVLVHSASRSMQRTVPGMRALSSMRAMRGAPYPIVQVASTLDCVLGEASLYLGSRPLQRLALLFYLGVLHLLVVWTRVSCSSHLDAVAGHAAALDHGLPGAGLPRGQEVGHAAGTGLVGALEKAAAHSKLAGDSAG